MSLIVSLTCGTELTNVRVRAADERAQFNTTYGKVLRKYGDYDTHLDEEKKARSSSGKLFKREDAHRRWGKYEGQLFGVQLVSLALGFSSVNARGACLRIFAR